MSKKNEPKKKNDKISEYERFINTAAADTEVVKIVLSTFLARMAEKVGVEMIDDLQQVAKRAVEKSVPDESAGRLAKRLHALKMAQLDEYFRLLRSIVQRTNEPGSRPVN